MITEIVHEFIGRFGQIHVWIGDDGESPDRVIEVAGVGAPEVTWKLHHPDLLFTLPTGEHSVWLEFRTTRGTLLGTFQRDISIGLGEDAFFVVDAPDFVHDEE